MGAPFNGGTRRGVQPPSYATGYQFVDITALPLISNLYERRLRVNYLL